MHASKVHVHTSTNQLRLLGINTAVISRLGVSDLFRLRCIILPSSRPLTGRPAGTRILSVAACLTRVTTGGEVVECISGIACET